MTAVKCIYFSIIDPVSKLLTGTSYFDGITLYFRTNLQARIKKFQIFPEVAFQLIKDATQEQIPQRYYRKRQVSLRVGIRKAKRPWYLNFLWRGVLIFFIAFAPKSVPCNTLLYTAHNCSEWLIIKKIKFLYTSISQNKYFDLQYN